MASSPSLELGQVHVAGLVERIGALLVVLVAEHDRPHGDGRDHLVPLAEHGVVLAVVLFVVGEVVSLAVPLVV